MSQVNVSSRILSDDEIPASILKKIRNPDYGFAWSHRLGGTYIDEKWMSRYVCGHCKHVEEFGGGCCPTCGSGYDVWGHKSIRFIPSDEGDGGVIEVQGLGQFPVKVNYDRLDGWWHKRLHPDPSKLHKEPRSGFLEKLVSLFSPV